MRVIHRHRILVVRLAGLCTLPVRSAILARPRRRDQYDRRNSSLVTDELRLYPKDFATLLFVVFVTFC